MIKQMGAPIAIVAVLLLCASLVQAQRASANFTALRLGSTGLEPILPVPIT
jgi:hypothetical protein